MTIPIPADWLRRRERDRERHCAMYSLAVAWDRWCERHPVQRGPRPRGRRRGVTAAARLAAFQAEYGCAARRAGLRVSRRTLSEYARRFRPGDRLFCGTCDNRGGPGRPKPRATRPTETRFYFEVLLRRRAIASVKDAWREADDTARRLGWPRFGLRSGQRIARALPVGSVRVGTYARRLRRTARRKRA